MPASAKGTAREASTPTTEKATVPATRRQRQPRSQHTSSGTDSPRQTIDNSSGVRLTDVKGPPSAQRGTAVPAANLQTAKVGVKVTRLSGRNNALLLVRVRNMGVSQHN